MPPPTATLRHPKTAKTAFLAALVAIGGFAALSVADDGGSGMIASTAWNEVCASDGRPGSAYSRAHRIVARKPVRGHQIDHIVPLCIGGADVDANIQVEPIEEALRKDEIERAVCIAVCRDRTMSLAEGQAIFTSGRWREMLR